MACRLTRVRAGMVSRGMRPLGTHLPPCVTITKQRVESIPWPKDAETHLKISRADMADILERYSNPSYGGRPAGRLDAVLHDPARSRDLVVNWIFTQTKLSIMRGNVITPQLFLLICKRVSIEALLHDSLGLPASLHRAGCLFEKERLQWSRSMGAPRPGGSGPDCGMRRSAATWPAACASSWTGGRNRSAGCRWRTDAARTPTSRIRSAAAAWTRG